jgi:hypothetical protein
VARGCRLGRGTPLALHDSVNISGISACYGSSTPRGWSGSADRRDPSRCDDSGRAGCSSGSTWSIQPPWRVLPWPVRGGPVAHRPTAAATVVKAPAGCADVNGVGRMLDLFV